MKHIPNLLSFLRIILLPVIVYCFFHQQREWTIGLFALSGISDALDGYLARRNGWVSQLGKVLDPAADKLTQLTFAAILVYQLRSWWPFFAVIFIKEILMLSVGGYFIKKGVKLEGAKILGKCYTALFYLFVLTFLVWEKMPNGVITAFLSVLVLLAVTSLLGYVPEVKRYWDEAHS